MLPKLIEFGGFYLPTYGVMVALGFLAGLWVTSRLGQKVGIDGEKISNLAISCALAGLLGAKLMMFVFEWDRYVENPSLFFSLETLQAAGVYQGGFILAFIAAVFLIRNYKLPPLLTMDAFAPGIAIGHAIGRLGCLAAGCCWGGRCDRPWAITFTDYSAYEITGVPLGIPLHPTQIYESVFNLVLFFFLYRLFLKRPAPGTVIGLYLVAYSVGRFFMEFFRDHAQELIGPFSNTQWISIAIAIVGFLILWFYARPTASSRMMTEKN